MSTSSLFRFSACLKAALFFFLVLFVGCQADPESEPAPLSALAEDKMGPNRPNSAHHNKILAEIRQATAHYHNIEAALADGYVPFSPCVSHPMLGGMGYHYLNEDLVDGVLNHQQPEVLLYEPQKNGRMKLVGVEYIIVAGLWMQSNPPMLGDQAFDVYIDSPANPLPFDNYQLHTWVWKHNPAGMHTAFNPMVTCDFAEDSEGH